MCIRDRVIGLTKDILKRSDIQIEEDLRLIGSRVLEMIKSAKSNNVSVLSSLKASLI